VLEAGRQSSELGAVGGTYLFHASEHLGSMRSPLAVALADRAL
jgi:hypothetical protein